MECPECGAFITEEDLFCGECGKPIAGREPPAETPTRPESQAETVELSPAPPAAPVVLAPATRPVPSAPAAAQPKKGVFSRVQIAVLIGLGALMVCLCVGGIVIWWALSEDEPVTVPTASVVEPSVLLYEDGFGDASSGWDRYEDEDVSTDYVNGEYAVSVFTDYYMGWGNPDPGVSLRDYVFDVDIRQVEGPIDNNYGILLRYEVGDEEDSFYWFQISSDGFYTVDLHKGAEWNNLVGWEASDAINQGVGATNHLQVIASGDQFSMFVNGVFLVELTDDTLGAGNIGLATGAFDETGVVIHFDNVQLRSLPD